MSWFWWNGEDGIERRSFWRNKISYSFQTPQTCCILRCLQFTRLYWGGLGVCAISNAQIYVYASGLRPWWEYRGLLYQTDHPRPWVPPSLWYDAWEPQGGKRLRASRRHLLVGWFWPHLPKAGQTNLHQRAKLPLDSAGAAVERWLQCGKQLPWHLESRMHSVWADNRISSVAYGRKQDEPADEDHICKWRPRLSGKHILGIVGLPSELLLDPAIEQSKCHRVDATPFHLAKVFRKC